MSTEVVELSPYTGYTRTHWAERADRLLLALPRFASPDHARIDLPGQPSAYGRDSDALEAFARSFLLAAIRLRGENGHDPHSFAHWYAEGLVAGTDPTSPTAWPRPDQLGQAKVEACSIALGLHLSRPWLWDRLASREQQRVVRWLSTVVGEEYPPINWVWFQLVVEAFLRSVDGPWSQVDVDRALAVHESLYRGHGWYSDGAERAYDHYNGWALHVYPLLWADMVGDLCPPELRQTWRERLAAFVGDAALLVGADGSPLLQGRSLIYRFAAAAPFWVSAMFEAGGLEPGVVRRLCSGMLRHFESHGVPDRQGLLSLGWHHEWPALAQSYSGPGSPYWAVKGMLGLALPSEHPVWTEVEQPLPVEREDTLRALPAPGWLVCGTRRDGIVRVVNHGTDHALVGDDRADSPLYARLGYSTATLPPLGQGANASPPDNSVTIVDTDGVAAHRNGFELLGCELVDDTAWAVSRARLHWVSTDDDTAPDHGSGRRGATRQGPLVTMGSAVRGGVEVRVARLDSADGLAPGMLLEFSGWPVAHREPPVVQDLDQPPGCSVTGRDLTSSVVGLTGSAIAFARRDAGTSPLAEQVAVPVLRTAAVPTPGEVYVAVVELAGAGLTGQRPAVRVEPAGEADRIVVRWPDGVVVRVLLPRA